MPETNPILQSLYARKSVRVFEEKAIPAGMKQAILEAAAQAPSAGCQQLYTILDITDPKDALYVLMFVLAIDAEKCSRN
jgi:nitroreductase